MTSVAQNKESKTNIVKMKFWGLHLNFPTTLELSN